MSSERIYRRQKIIYYQVSATVRDEATLKRKVNSGLFCNFF